ncbi:MAG: CDP-alcohol phosphatidyltransferase family protein [Proteobacteria bacterium]|nr:CDP-alcohol phosphatidyltransferase family protein [Pseudomonadota bacterium]
MGKPSLLFFPIIRLMARPVSRVLLKTSFSANQVTAASLGCGLISSAFMLPGKWEMTVLGSLFLIACYVFDNCDGEIARAKNQCSEFGRHFDDFSDWAVHTSFFLALGIGTARAEGNDVWMWLGWIAAGGAVLNSIVGKIVERREKRRLGDKARTGHESPEEAKRPDKWHEWAVFIFRELSRANFCFLVFILALFNFTWLLLPAGAIGSQVYWATKFVRGADQYHL